MAEKMFKTPVLFLIFNRPETTQKVFDEIKKAKPPKLFVAADGARADREGEAEKCQQTRDIIKQVDWDCEVFTLFREQNLGCKNAVSSAISWFFENVEEGIILEDDCLPDQSFFMYCQEMLEKYRHEDKVMIISGTSLLFNRETSEYSYFFSRYYAIWGWACWRRAWNLYDINQTKWLEYKKNELLYKIFENQKIVDFYEHIFDLTAENKINTWDIQWVYSCLTRGGLSIVPVNNLISNIGFVGTHTDEKPSDTMNMPVKQFDLQNIKPPPEIAPNIRLDTIAFDNIGIFKEKPKKTIKSRFKKLLKKLIKRGNRE